MPDNRTLESREPRLVVEQFMTWPAVTVGPDATVTDAIAAMDRGHFDHLLIRYRDWFGGTLCRSDLADVNPHAIVWQFADEVAAVPAEVLVIDAVRRMSSAAICCLPVTSLRGIWGIVTLSDLVLAPPIESLIPSCDSCGSFHRVRPLGTSSASFCDACREQRRPFPFDDEYVDLGTVD